MEAYPLESRTESDGRSCESEGASVRRRQDEARRSRQEKHKCMHTVPGTKTAVIVPSASDDDGLPSS